MSVLAKIVTDRDAFIALLGEQARHPDVVKALSRSKDDLLDDAVAYYFVKRFGVLPWRKKPERYGKLTKRLCCGLEETIKLMK
ncbi:MAG: hypothetical protein Q8K86_10685 [Candidatus Nanopelagicaceae bacterium]|nr:hypothetical protein [Candidatus Nanopelagicaceae bacterium]